MAKYTPSTVAAGLNSAAAINQNFQEIADNLNDKVLYRNNPDGEPNTILQDIDMNSNKLINLKDGVANQDAVTVGQAKTLLSNIRAVETITAISNGQTLITFASLVYTLGIKSIQIYVNGVYQEPAAYTETSTSSITLSEGIDIGDRVMAVVLFG